MISYEEFEDIVVNILNRDISSNKDQRNAILSPSDKSLFIVAGPGSGKTTVMVLKILKYIFVDDIEDVFGFGEPFLVNVIKHEFRITESIAQHAVPDHVTGKHRTARTHK